MLRTVASSSLHRTLEQHCICTGLCELPLNLFAASLFME